MNYWHSSFATEFMYRKFFIKLKGENLCALENINY
jgi:hypothetical protein